MKRVFFTIFAVVVFMGSKPAFAHVPYLEEVDFTREQPFKVPKSIEQSIAVYAWLEFKDSYTEDIDVYTFTLTAPARVFVQCLVPECDRYKEFLPWFAIVGPGLPEPEYTLVMKLSIRALILEGFEKRGKGTKFFSFLSVPALSVSYSTGNRYKSFRKGVLRGKPFFKRVFPLAYQHCLPYAWHTQLITAVKRKNCPLYR